MTANRMPILTERESTHGSYALNATIAQELKRIVRHYGGEDRLSAPQLESIDLIFTKIARIVAGNAAFEEHWKDIQGYAELGREACAGRLPKAPPAEPVEQLDTSPFE